MHTKTYNIELNKSSTLNVSKKNLPVYNHLQSSNGGDGQSSQNKCVHIVVEKQTAKRNNKK